MKIKYFFASSGTVLALATLASGCTPPTVEFTDPLNDTGLTRGANYPTGLNSICSGVNIAQQDCRSGRDFTHNDNSDGHAGFSFIKIGAAGERLPASASEWSCVLDNTTGLMWEVKSQGNSQLYNYQNALNIHRAGMNADELCGYSDWDLPTFDQLHNIANYGNGEPFIDVNYFPHAGSEYYWSNTVDSEELVFNLCFSFSNPGLMARNDFTFAGPELSVRLVRRSMD